MRSVAGLGVLAGGASSLKRYNDLVRLPDCRFVRDDLGPARRTLPGDIEPESSTEPEPSVELEYRSYVLRLVKGRG